MGSGQRAGAVILLCLALAAATAAFYGHFGSGLGPAQDFARLRQWITGTLGLRLPGTPDLGNLDARLAERGIATGAPVFIRIFKAESVLELWLMKEGRFTLFASYPICRWSGGLGPKLKEGDRQAPEGVYTVDAGALNPNSRWHRSFNLGFPNLLDRAHGRTGSFLMVHGGCSSVGCFAMTDPVMDEIWRLVTAALASGQPRFQVHVFPFRMTEARLGRMAGHPWHDFWSTLKSAHDIFAADLLPPRVTVCGGAYRFTPTLQRAAWMAEITEECPPAGPLSRNASRS